MDPKYCTRCGAALESVIVATNHDPQTGEPRPERELRCPRYKPPSLFRSPSRHDIFWLNRDGNAIPIWVR